MTAYDPAAELSKRTKALVDRHFSDRVKLSRDMKQMGVSRKHLTEVFKQQYAIMPSQYLILIPCHRVIGADGSLTGYAAGIAAKQFLLQKEITKLPGVGEWTAQMLLIHVFTRRMRQPQASISGRFQPENLRRKKQQISIKTDSKI